MLAKARQDKIDAEFKKWEARKAEKARLEAKRFEAEKERLMTERRA